MPTKKLILNQIAIKKLQDSFSIPTKIRYQTGSYGSNKVVIGYEAEKQVNNPNSIIENFKIELGKFSFSSNSSSSEVNNGINSDSPSRSDNDILSNDVKKDFAIIVI